MKRGPKPRSIDPVALAEQYATCDWTLKELGRAYGLTRERIRQLISTVDPGLTKAVKQERASRRAERQRAERQVRESKTQRDPCAVCLGPVRVGRKGPASVTCSAECAGLWATTRYHLSPERHDQQMRAIAGWWVENAEEHSRITFGLRFLSSQPPLRESYGRWVNSEKVRQALIRIYELRQDRTDPRWPIDVTLQQLLVGGKRTYNRRNGPQEARGGPAATSGGVTPQAQVHGRE